MQTDGSGVQRLTLDPSFDSWWARISPDRRRVLFYRTPVGAPGQDYSRASLWVMNADGSDQRQLRAPHTDGWEVQGHADWSPDGHRLVMFGGAKLNTQLFITDDEGQHPQQLTRRPAMNLDPSWSPDGEAIAFVGCAGVICFEKDYEIFTIPASGGNAKQLTSNAIRDHDPYFSPDGQRIAWIAETQPNAIKPGVGSWNIFVMNRDGSDQHRVTNDREINSVPRWSPDGTALYFHRFEPDGKERWGIYRIGIDGTGLTEITDSSLANSEYPSL